MSVIKLYGLSISTCTKRVATILKEKNVPYEFIPVDMMAGEHTSPEYLQSKQPFGQIPYIDDNGYILYESRAIGRYIAVKYANQGTKGLVPEASDFEAIGQFEQACSTEYAQFNPSAEGLVYEVVFKKYKGEETDPAAVARFTATLEKKLNAYDQILSKRKYLAGDHVTIADLFHLPYGEMASSLKSDIISSRPNVARWWNDITSRESWHSVKNGV